MSLRLHVYTGLNFISSSNTGSGASLKHIPRVVVGYSHTKTFGW